MTRETILYALERGLPPPHYRKAPRPPAVTEQVMSKERVPPGYRFYDKALLSDDQAREESGASRYNLHTH